MNIAQFDPSLFFKIAIEILLFLYTIFAFVIVTQIKTMNRIITQPPIGGILASIGWIHVLLAASLFLLGLAIL
jgi:hypothetical protein